MRREKILELQAKVEADRSKAIEAELRYKQIESLVKLTCSMIAEVCTAEMKVLLLQIEEDVGRRK